MFLFSCSDDLESRIKGLEDAIETKEIALKAMTDKRDAVYEDYLEAVENYEACETDNALKNQEVEALNKTISELKADNEALLKRLAQVEFDNYEAQMNYDINIVQTTDELHRYVLEPSLIPHAQIYNVIGYQPGKNNINESNDVSLDWGQEAYEVVSFLVEGEIYNLKWSQVTWDDAYQEYTIGEAIESIEIVKDQRVNIHTMLPEGLPYEMISFENSAGQIFEILLSYDGYGFEGRLLIVE